MLGVKIYFKEPSKKRARWASLGFGKGVSQSTYFGSLPSKKEYKHELIEVNARLKRMEHEIMVLKNGRSNNEVSEKGNLDESCYDDVALNETPYIPDNAALNALLEPNYQVVAIGKVHNTGEVAHTLSLSEGFMRVGIDYAIEKQTPLPVPNEDAEAFVIKEAIGALVLWPTQLIVTDMPLLTLITIEKGASREKFYDLSGASRRRESCCNVLRATERGSGGGCYQLLNREDGKILGAAEQKERGSC
ncbi:Adenosylcobinamide-GDP ribazoletransferase [Bienertia sinuspersici]